MKTENGVVSVIIAAFNAERTLERTVASALSQTEVSLEIVIVDDGSTDGTSGLARKIARSDNRVRVYRQENRGAAVARNHAVRESNGEWIAPLDADDIWYPEYLSRQLRRAQEKGDPVGVVYTWSRYIDHDDAPLPGISAASIEGNVYGTILCHNFLGNASCTLLRRSAFDVVGGYDESLIRTEDWDLYLRLAERFNFAVVEEYLVGYRQNVRGASRNHLLMAQGQARMLAKARVRNPGVPRWLCRLSQANLYIFFARRHKESDEIGLMKEWLRRAAGAHWLTLLRPDWWWLLAYRRQVVRTASVSRCPASDPLGRRWESLIRVLISELVHRSLGRLVRISLSRADDDKSFR
jgi:glycosyltransferase involved in cell wall biosynthesis